MFSNAEWELFGAQTSALLLRSRRAPEFRVQLECVATSECGPLLCAVYYMLDGVQHSTAFASEVSTSDASDLLHASWTHKRLQNANSGNWRTKRLNA